MHERPYRSKGISEEVYKRERLVMLRLERSDRIEDKRHKEKISLLQERTYAVARNTFIAGLFINGLLAVVAVISSTYAYKANNISASNIQLQLRAYLVENNVPMSLPGNQDDKGATIGAGNEEKASSDEEKSTAQAEQRNDIYSEINPPIYSGVSVKNFGQTPAYNVILYNAIGIVRLDQGGHAKQPYFFSDYCTNESKAAGETGEFSIGASAESNFSSHTVYHADGTTGDKFSEGEMDDFLAKKSLLGFWGIICYSDIFGEPHFKRYCRYYASKKEFEDGFYNSCSDHNDSDGIKVVK